jgi:hypothetical protein
VGTWQGSAYFFARFVWGCLSRVKEAAYGWSDFVLGDCWCGDTCGVWPGASPVLAVFGGGGVDRLAVCVVACGGESALSLGRYAYEETAKSVLWFGDAPGDVGVVELVSCSAQSSLGRVVVVAGFDSDGQGGKLVHHVCGYPLRSAELTRFDGELSRAMGVARLEEGTDVLVGYRDAGPGALPMQVFCCPGCGRPLKLWWRLPA